MRRGEDGAARGVDIKPGPGHAGWISVTDLWRPRFADFLHDQVAAPGPAAKDRHIGGLVNDALAAGLSVPSIITLGDGAPRDVGTREGLAREWHGDLLY